MDEFAFVILASNRMEADIMIATLASEGIAATWREVVPEAGLVSGSFGPIEILVLRENHERGAGAPPGRHSLTPSDERPHA